MGALADLQRRVGLPQDPRQRSSVIVDWSQIRNTPPPDFLPNALGYGADPTGTANSVAAIDRAIADGVSGLHFPKGTYLFTFSASDTTISVTSDFLITGEGPDSTILKMGPDAPTAAYKLFSPVGTVRFEVRDLTMRGPTNSDLGDAEPETYAISHAVGTDVGGGYIRCRNVVFDGDWAGNVESPSGASNNANGVHTIELFDCDLSAYHQNVTVFYNNGNAEKHFHAYNCIFRESGIPSGHPGYPFGHSCYIHPGVSYWLENCEWKTTRRYAFHNYGSPTDKPKYQVFVNCLVGEDSASGLLINDNGTGLFEDFGSTVRSVHGFSVGCPSKLIGTKYRPQGVYANTQYFVATRSGSPRTIDLIGPHIDTSDMTAGAAGAAIIQNNHAVLIRVSELSWKHDSAAACQHGIGSFSASALYEIDGFEVYNAQAVDGPNIDTSGGGDWKIRRLRYRGRGRSAAGAVSVGASTVGLDLEDCDFSAITSGAGLYGANVTPAGLIRHRNCKWGSATGHPNLNIANLYAHGTFRDGIGANIASAATLSVGNSDSTYHVTGTTTIDTIKVNNADTQQRAFHGARLYLIADGAWATSTAGNIKPKTTAARTVGTVVTLIYDANSGFWYEVA